MASVTGAPGSAVREDAAAEAALEGRFHLVLLDDDAHTYAYVVEMLGRIFGYGREKAFVLARMVDTTGRVIVETAARTPVERHQRQIHAYGPDPRLEHSQGSMSAIIEAAP